ncbi:MAG: SDR family oxidoreductase [Hyphomicrobiaceae bacterium]|nr:SDR family oxidoreductase [Hyphomicrobiaceae bacterium]
MTNVALVAGAHGIVGGAIVADLARRPGWRVIGLGRRGGQDSGTVTHQAVDLTDATSCRRAAAQWSDVTHVFYTAYLPGPDLARETETNTKMLTHLVEALEPVTPHLQHIQLMQGSKWYGNHLGPYRTPSHEDDPRHGAPCFYYDQQDWLAARQLGKNWGWSALRPHGVLGLAIGSSMNQLTAMALYASVQRQFGTVLYWPGSDAAFNSLYQFVESAYLARGAHWMATEHPRANAPFNFTNGDLVRWKYLWPLIAEAFGMEPGPPAPQKLAERMSQHEELWAQLVTRHGLQPHRMDALTNWRFADFVFHSGYDHISDMTRARNLGWTGANPSHEMYVRLIGDLRTHRIIP